MNLNFITLIIRIISFFLPKDNKKIAFASVPDYSGNAIAFYEFLSKRKHNYKLKWITEKSLTKDNIRSYRKNSFFGLYHILTSKFIITTHSNYILIKSKRQILIDLWHGMPLKSIGVLSNNNNKKFKKNAKIRSEKVDLTIATSEMFRHILASCFIMDPNKIVITGQMRNDKLFLGNKDNTLKKITNQNFVKTILYTPTYRDSFDRSNREIGDIFSLTNFDLSQLIKILEKNNCLLLIKLHPYEEKLMGSKIMDLPSNIKIIDSTFMNEVDLELYELMGNVDLLITDYSSIYFDFLLLNRPIIFITEDAEKYNTDRGFLLEPLDFWMPGAKVTTFNQLINEINMNINEDRFHENRKIVNKLVNKHEDSDSCERLLQELNERYKLNL